MNAILYEIDGLFVINSGIIIAGGQKLEKSLPLINTSKKCYYMLSRKMYSFSPRAV